ncbi:hypothetical protein DAMA08_001880 [Martiniozyma asiatica (nom. inval.)]|nr:hypothetical protein DAMA08_001880 [Martiniozyma asiatica]
MQQQQPKRQVTRLMAAASKCATESTVYGKCIVQNYQNMQKDACVQEFMLLKKCVLKNLKPT